MTNKISAEELKKRLQDDNHDEILIDVRDPFEHKSQKIGGSENIPLNTISDAVERLKDIGTVYVHCQSGNRSAQACDLLRQHNVNVVDVEGGINAWRESGFELVGTTKAIPMMRQVMIVAGSLILVGFLLGALVSPWWMALPAIVGAGLLFAGVTGICGMTHTLKCMPWNRV